MPRDEEITFTEYQELGDLAREGLEVLSDAPLQRRALPAVGGAS